MIVRTYHSEVRRLRTDPVPVQRRAPTNVRGTWSPDEARTLDTLLTDGWSYSGIARKLGRSRSSVAGLDWRRRQA